MNKQLHRDVGVGVVLLVFCAVVFFFATQISGQAAYLPVPRRDDKFLLLQATCAIPLLFPPIVIDGVPCLDGGCADAIPWRRALELGCDRLVVVLTRERSYRKKPDRMGPLMERAFRKYPAFLETLADRAER